MNNEDLSNIISNLSQSINSGNTDFSALINQLTNSNKSQNNQNNSSQSFSENTNSSTSNNVNNSPFGNIDMETILKMSSLIEKMNINHEDPRANLLLSLKPYLKESRKDKIEQYIKLFHMAKIFELLNSEGFSLGGGDKSK